MTINDRIAGAIWGQLCGDAAALGSHWIYDLDEMKRSYPGGLRGFEEPIEGHYHFGKHAGEQTPYGDAALLMLESVAELGHFDERDFGRRFIAFFSDYPGYIDHATRDTLQRYADFCRYEDASTFDYQLGADDDQLGTASRLAPVVVAHRADRHLAAVVTRATWVTQYNDYAVRCMVTNAALLASFLEGAELEAAVGWAPPHEGLRAALEARNVEVVPATARFGKACPLPQSFPSALQTLLHHSDDYKAAILACLEAGGDNAGRAAMLGAWMGARLGVDAIPAEWRARLKAGEAITRHVSRLSQA